MEKIFFKTYGCTMNFSDTEVMMGLVSGEDYIIADKEDDADLLVVNTCTVKDPSESKALVYINKWRLSGKKVIVTGCIPQAERNHPLLQDLSLLGTTQVYKIVDAVEETLAGNVVHWLSHGMNPRLNLPKIRRNNLVEVIPINEGCLGHCHFCKTKLARGNLMSYSPDAIVEQFRSALSEGIYEFWLTSQDTGAYGMDIKTNIAELLDMLTSVEGDFRIRVGMANPDMLKIRPEQIISAMKHPKVYKFLHMPVQSGSNSVLKKMNRMYRVEDALELISRFRREIPDLTVATDIICGYPGETDADHRLTLDSCKKAEFEVMNVSKFYARKGTKAAGMKQLDSLVVKSRSEELGKLHKQMSIGRDKLWVGRSCRVFVDELGSVPGSFVGRNDSYRPVVIDVADGVNLLGTFVDVKIYKAENHSLFGSIV